MWEVLSRPASTAVLEILQASRSDPELATKVIPVQASLDRAGLEVVQQFSTAEEAEQVARLRFFHWAIRGLSIGRILTSEPDEIARSVTFLRALVESAVATGLMTNGSVDASTGIADRRAAVTRRRRGRTPKE